MLKGECGSRVARGAYLLDELDRAALSANTVRVFSELLRLTPARRYAVCLGRTLECMACEAPRGLREYLTSDEYGALCELSNRGLRSLHERLTSLLCLYDRHVLAQQLAHIFDSLRAEGECL